MSVCKLIFYGEFPANKRKLNNLTKESNEAFVCIFFFAFEGFVAVPLFF